MNMPATPPRSMRVHTPPTPLHGPKHDNWEPYSPRRSTRLAAQHKQHLHDDRVEATPSKQRPSPRFARATTPPSARKASLRSASSQYTLSPPSSPSSPAKHRLPTQRKSPRSLKKHTAHFDAHAVGVDSDSDHGHNSNLLRPARLDVDGLLPTPAKTPRKRHHNEAALKSTARVLFPNRPATIEDAMPTPRKSRKGRKHDLFSLGSSMGQGEDEDSSKIEIYTDSKERIPSLDEDDNNPFVTRRNGKGKAANGRSESRRRRQSNEQMARMEQAVRREEGMIYVFRGKKIFRKFEGACGRAEDSSSEEFSDSSIRRQAGTAALSRLTRSSIKPRLLFPSEEQRRAREASEEDDEEATTDIEVPEPAPARTPRKKHHRATAHLENSTTQREHSTPVKKDLRLMTPPPTVRHTRASAKKEAERAHDEVDAPMEQETVQERPPEQILPQQAPRPKKLSPFDSWQRKKTGSRLLHAGTKREGSPILNEGESSKRTRSGTYTHASQP